MLAKKVERKQVGMTDQMGCHSLIREHRRRWISLCVVEAGSRNTHLAQLFPAQYLAPCRCSNYTEVGCASREKRQTSLFSVHFVPGGWADVTQGLVTGAKVIQIMSYYVRPTQT